MFPYKRTHLGCFLCVVLSEFLTLGGAARTEDGKLLPGMPSGHVMRGPQTSSAPLWAGPRSWRGSNQHNNNNNRNCQVIGVLLQQLTWKDQQEATGLVGRVGYFNQDNMPNSQQHTVVITSQENQLCWSELMDSKNAQDCIVFVGMPCMFV